MIGHTAPSLPPQVRPPRFSTSELAPHAVPGVEVLALPVLAPGVDGTLALGPGSAEAVELLGAAGIDLLATLEVLGASGAVGEALAQPVPEGIAAAPELRTVLLVGVGDASRDAVRRAGATLARATRGRGLVASTLHLVTDEGLEPFVVGALLGSFSFAWRSTPEEQPPAEQVVLAGSGTADAAALDRAVALGAAGWRSRALATVPSNLKSPQWLADQAVDVAAQSGLDVRVWDEVELAAEGFGGILAVGRASATPPRLVRLDYSPPGAGRRTPTVVLVGKGITFDTGGLSIKPADGMVTMKRDMTGGAVVIATLAALGAVGCPVRVVGLVPIAENAVSGDATRPGDVVTHWGGRTTEVTNTDAEGRVVLADALAYAVAELEPTAVVDVATLTGAVKVALGQQVGGYFATDDALAASLGAAAATAGEPLWRLPLSSLYEEKLSSKIADADNAPAGPGAITAALFLRHFVGEVPWAHLDIASVGDSPQDAFEWTAGPTGFGTRALLTWLGSDDPLAGVGG